MDADGALRFLAEHQPMPGDTELSDALIRAFDEVRDYFVRHPDPRCIPLFLGSLPPSGSSGFGVYQLLDDVLRVHDRNLVVDCLASALRDPSAARVWVMDLALEYADRELVSLANLLAECDDEDLAEVARSYLSLHG